MNFGASKFITVRLISLLYYDRHFHVRMDVAMIGIGTRFLKRERKGTDNLGQRHSDLALQVISLQRSKLLFHDNLFEISSAFERAKLQYFDVCLCHSQF